ncbi:MAG: ATP phosphoribosyltransferase [Oscillospiraceae bacterium]|nr:ATP phosphoribosyltransferase [Oscillospiraceae bacterium]
MEVSKDILNYDEQIILELRTLYNEFGYSQYRMSRFEEYELYAENKAFLPSGEILAFTGINGRLMALRPDVTLSIVKYAKDDGKTEKLYYNENVYRSDGADFKEQMQVGLECIGNIDTPLIGEVLLLAKQSLDILSDKSKLDISHMGFPGGLLQSEKMTLEQRNTLINCINNKNTPELKTLCLEYGLSNEFEQRLTKLASLYGFYEDVKDQLKELCINDEMTSALNDLDALDKVLRKTGINKNIKIDFSIINDISYYSGIIFQGYIEGVPARVLSGGRYDELLQKFGKKSGAIGFAVYLNNAEFFETAQPEEKDNYINIALPKGRLGEKAYAIFEAAGYGCPEIREESRKLVFENQKLGIRYFWVKPSDVARYVERGAACIGVAGKDILQEQSPDIYELLDLKIGKCNISVAAEKEFSPEKSNKTLRVATKFPNITRAYYQKQGREIDIIELNGSIELAPLLGLSDVIVDIVETGQTLLANNLEPKELILDVSARLISNKASYKFNYEKIDKICESIKSAADN